MIRTILTVGRNRGKPRLWLQAAYMAEHGWDRGTRYNVTLSPGRVLIQATDEGKRKVAGKPGKPIIDLNSKALAEAFQPGDKVDLTFNFGRIEGVLA